LINDVLTCKLTYLKAKIVGAFAFQMQARVARSTAHSILRTSHCYSMTQSHLTHSTIVKLTLVNFSRSLQNVVHMPVGV